MWFDIDYNKLIIQLLPTFLRGPMIVTYLQCLVYPIAVVYARWLDMREDQNYRLAHNGQVCYLRKALNDAFDPEQRRIDITDGEVYPRVYLFTEIEQPPEYLGTLYLRTRGEFDGVDFRVILPQGFNLAQVEDRMRATIENYKLASKRYTIQYDE